MKIIKSRLRNVLKATIVIKKSQTKKLIELSKEAAKVGHSILKPLQKQVQATSKRQIIGGTQNVSRQNNEDIIYMGFQE